MRDRDYGEASDFLAQFFAGTSHAVEVRALPNERGAGPSRPLFTRDGALVEAHCRRWDGPDRAVYFGVATRTTGAPSGKREDCAELPAVWVDIDTYKHGINKEPACSSLRAMPLPPSVIIDSGGGLHAYWMLREAIDLSAANDDDDIIAVLKQLAGVCCGDLAVCDIARIMRLPGTTNTKDGRADLVRVIHADWDHRVEFDDLVDMLDYLRPVIVAPRGHNRATNGLADNERGPVVATNPFSSFAQRYGFKAPLDVERRLAAMVYLGDGENGVHQTQLQVSASLVMAGVDDDTIAKTLLDATAQATNGAAQHWNWKREEKIIREMIASARKKFAVQHKDKLPAPNGDARNDPPAGIEHREKGSDALRPKDATQGAPAGGAEVVSLVAERQRRKDAKAPEIARAGDAVIAWYKVTRGEFVVVEGTPWTYRRGLWTAWGKGDHHALRTGIQGILAAAGVDPKTQLLNAIYRYVIEHPELAREGIDWDNSGLVVCLDGAIDPLTRVVVEHSPDHWATAGAEVEIARMGEGCPQWLYFLDSCFSDLEPSERDAVVGVLQEWFGAAIVRRKPRELRKALWLHGESRTGKTRVAEVFRLLVGEPIASAKLRILEKNFGAAALLGKRAWVSDDAVSSADEVDDAIFKNVVTGEAISLDVKHAAHETVRFNLPVLFTSNPLPRVKDQSDAVFNRSLLLKMRVVRSEEETENQPLIEDVVKAGELAAVFSWALDGWARLRARGRFLPPQTMLDAGDEFKTANNPVMAWAKIAVEASPGMMVDRRDLYASFKGWYAAEYGDKARPPSQRFFIGGVRQNLQVESHDHILDGYRLMIGLKLTADGLAFRRDCPRDLGMSPGSGRDDDMVNRWRP